MEEAMKVEDLDGAASGLSDVLCRTDQAEDLYCRLHALSKTLESCGVIDEHKDKDAYATILDAMNFVNAERDA